MNYVWTPEEIALTRYAWRLYEADCALRRRRIRYRTIMGTLTMACLAMTVIAAAQ